MTFYTHIRCSWPHHPSFFLSIEAPSASVALAVAEGWIAGFAVGTDQSVTLEITDLTSKKPRGVTYHAIKDWMATREGVHS